MTSTEYTNFQEATKGLAAAVAEGKNHVQIMTHFDNEKNCQVWTVVSVPSAQIPATS
ncbi:hypothetical protein [Tardiphaga sp. 367_B4_N1_1]|jgi:hypothetical protein|uniref:hypothetical protein n=1 Tax=Tardiphaga sp. 367_B4_N1_1 TaxID=3240777 RepID=UPI003F283959